MANRLFFAKILRSTAPANPTLALFLLDALHNRNCGSYVEKTPYFQAFLTRLRLAYLSPTGNVPERADTSEISRARYCGTSAVFG